jgi:anti-sigma-K factor RskA
LNNSEHLRVEELQLLAVGALPEPEAAAIQTHVCGCVKCGEELAEARGTAALLSFAMKQEQAAGTVKAELMARIRANRKSEERDAWPRKVMHEPEVVSPGRRMRVSWWTWALSAAAVVLAVVSVGLSWQNRRIAGELQTERESAERLIHDREQIEKYVGVLAAPDTITVKLKGTEGARKASGVVRFNARTGVVLYAADLPQLPASKSYQVWLITANGGAISVGLLGPGGHAWGNMWTGEVPPNTEAKGFVVTVEAVGGVGQPTGVRVLEGTM